MPPSRKLFAGESVQRYSRTAKIKMSWMGFTRFSFRTPHSAFRIQKPRFFKRPQEILLNFRKFFSDDGWPRDKHKVNRLFQVVLMHSKNFAQQPPRAISFHSTTDFFARHNAKPRRAIFEFQPVCHENALCQPFALRARAGEIAALLDALPASEAQTRRHGARKIKPA